QPVDATQALNLSAGVSKWLASSMNDHVRPCNLKPQQRDLTPVLRRPVEPAAEQRKTFARNEFFAF
ncbi:MAG TPA: hypothetical protein VK567_07560, partial [Bradyrhizobium sp.]|nr:hypothetical protein [Bradyrhizobium sp.]